MIDACMIIVCLFLWFGTCFFIYKFLELKYNATHHEKSTLIHAIVLKILLVVVILKSIYLLI